MIVAVLVAARAAERFIGECLESIDAQELLPGWKCDVRVGVDDCARTSLAVERPHHCSRLNVGPYVMRNSLMALSPADAYAPFDADDIMLPGYLATLVGIAGQDGIAGGARSDIKEDGERTGKVHKFVHGVCVFSAAAMGVLGGYRAWPVVADFDIIARAGAAGVPVRKTREVLYMRRRHAGSLTNSPDVGMHATLRSDLTTASRKLTQAGERHVHPVTTPLVEVHAKR